MRKIDQEKTSAQVDDEIHASKGRSKKSFLAFNFQSTWRTLQKIRKLFTIFQHKSFWGKDAETFFGRALFVATRIQGPNRQRW